MKSSHLFKLTYLTVLATVLSACANTSQFEEKTLEEKFNEISISEKAADLLNTESDEVLIRQDLVCKNETKIGTRFKSKVCRTQAEMDVLRANAKRELETALRKNN